MNLSLVDVKYKMINIEHMRKKGRSTFNKT